jgi:hypothetical protein
MSSTPSSIGQEQTDVETQIDLFIRSDALNLGNITRFLGIEATSGFEAGAAYTGKTKIGGEIRDVERRYPCYGVWHFNTSLFMHHESLQEHALLLLERFEPVADRILQLKANPEYTVALILWHVGPAGFQFDSGILARLAKLSEWMSFTCWETEENE